MLWLVFVLHSTACLWISIFKPDQRLLPFSAKTHSHSKPSSSLKWKYVFYQTLRGLFTLTSAAPPICGSVPVKTICVSPSVHVLIMSAPWTKSCLAIRSSCFVWRLSSILHFMFWHSFWHESMWVIWHYQLCDLGACWCSHMLLCSSDLNWTSTWPWWASTKLLTDFLIKLILLHCRDD